VATASRASHLARTLSARAIPTSVAVGDDLGGSEATERLLFRSGGAPQRRRALGRLARSSAESHRKNIASRARARPDAWSFLSNSLALIRGRCPLSSWLSGKPPARCDRSQLLDADGNRIRPASQPIAARRAYTNSINERGERDWLCITTTAPFPDSHPQEQDSRAGCPFGDRGEASASNKGRRGESMGGWVEQAVDGRVRDDGAGLARITLIPVSVGGRVCCSEPGGGGFE
jgi:hypothetical protein